MQSKQHSSAQAETEPQQYVWDLFVRIFHWSLVCAFSVAFYYHDSEWDRVIHVRAGYVAGGLIIARIVWGCMKTGYASFKSFPLDPIGAGKYIIQNIRGRAKRFIGHNPAGSIVIYLMLALGISSVVSGYLVFNDGWLIDAPYLLHDIHFYTTWSWLGLVVMHISAVLFETIVHKDNLIRAMITGCKRKSTRSEQIFVLNKKAKLPLDP